MALTDKNAQEEVQGHQQAAEARPEQSRGGALRCFPHAGSAPQLFAGCESHGQEAELLRDDPWVMSSSWRPKGHLTAMVGDGWPVEWRRKV